MTDRNQALLQCSQQLHRAKARAAEFEHASRAELRRLHAENEALKLTQYGSGRMQALRDQRDALLAVAKELQESAAYWSEYDVPLGIVDRLNAAIAKAEA